MPLLLMTVLNWIKNLLSNPITWAVLAAVACFFAGWHVRGTMIEKAELKQGIVQQQQVIQAVQQTEVNYEQINKRYQSIRPDSKSSIESLLSYRTCQNCAAKNGTAPVTNVSPNHSKR